MFKWVTLFCVFMVYIGRNLQNKESVAFIILMLKDVLYT